MGFAFPLLSSGPPPPSLRANLFPPPPLINASISASSESEPRPTNKIDHPPRKAERELYIYPIYPRCGFVETLDGMAGLRITFLLPDSFKETEPLACVRRFGHARPRGIYHIMAFSCWLVGGPGRGEEELISLVPHTAILFADL